MVSTTMGNGSLWLPLRASRFAKWRLQREDAARALVCDFLFDFQPMLDVATEIPHRRAKCFATDERHGFRFDLAICTAPSLSTSFSVVYARERCGLFGKVVFMREGGEGLTAISVLSQSPDVAISRQWRARDIQRAERRVDVKAGSWRQVSIFPLVCASTNNTPEIGGRSVFVVRLSRPECVGLLVR